TVVDWSAPSWPGLRLRFSFVMFQCGVPALLLPAFVSMPNTRDLDRSAIRHLRVRIPNPCTITRPPFDVQVIEQPIIAILRFDLRNSRLWIADVTENDRFRRASLRARARERIARD